MVQETETGTETGTRTEIEVCEESPETVEKSQHKAIFSVLVACT